MPGPYAGLRVVEFGRFIAAPYCAQLLADGGADVIKVEPIEGDQTRYNGPIIPGEGRQFVNKNRGKRSIAVDLHQPEVLESVKRLVERADVIVANFRPGLAEVMGLDYDTVRQANPGVIYAETTGFGNNGPLAGEPAMDAAVQAYSGVAHLSSNGPELLANPVVDYGAALLLAWGIASALYVRERTGEGQRLDVALLQSALVMQNNTATHVDVIDGWRTDFVEYQRDALAQGVPWEEILQERQRRSPFMVARAYYGFFRTADGMVGIAAASKPLQRRMVAALGIEDPWVTEADFEIEDVKAHLDGVYDRVCEVVRAQPTAHWVKYLAKHGVPCREHNTVDDILANEQAWANDFLIRQEHDLLGGLTVVAPPVKFSKTPLAVTTASPVLGRHSREVLAEAGLDHATIDRIVASGAAVDGAA